MWKLKLFKREKRKNCDYIYIAHLRTHPVIDKIVCMVFKPFMIGGLYFMSYFTHWLMVKGGKRSDHFCEVSRKALRNSWVGERGISYSICEWSLNTFLNFCMIDNAYYVMYRRFIRQLIKESEKDKYKL